MPPNHILQQVTLPYLTTVSHTIHYQMIPLNNNHIIIHTTLPILYHPYCTIPSKNIPGYAKLPNPTILLLYHISKLPCYPLLAYHTTPLPYWWLPGTKLPIAQPLHFLLPHLSLFHPILFVPFIFSWHVSHMALLVLSMWIHQIWKFSSTNHTHHIYHLLLCNSIFSASRSLWDVEEI